MVRMRIALVAASALLAASLAGAQDFALDFQALGRILTVEESAALVGGETYVDVDLSKSRAVVTSIPRDRYGMDYSRASSYTVESHNRLATKDQPGTSDFYEAMSFPLGTTSMSVAKIEGDYRKGRYGSSSGEWITTPATRSVVAYPIKADGTADKSKPYTRKDGGYFIHANNAIPFSESTSAGCIIVKQKSLDRIIATIKADSGKKRLSVRD